MPIVNATTARNNFFKIMEDVVITHEPIYVTGKAGNVVVISEEDYRSIQETLYLISIPGMREKILRGLNTPLEALYASRSRSTVIWCIRLLKRRFLSLLAASRILSSPLNASPCLRVQFAVVSSEFPLVPGLPSSTSALVAQFCSAPSSVLAGV